MLSSASYCSMVRHRTDTDSERIARTLSLEFLSLSAFIVASENEEKNELAVC